MKIAVSGCLLGEAVRYDGGDKQNSFIVDELAKYAELFSFCPESIVFGIPRPSVKLVKEDGSIRVKRNCDDIDVTQELKQGVLKELERLEGASAIIFKARSPSCGLGSTTIFVENEVEHGYGLFAKACKERYPLLLMQEEDKLDDPCLREQFLTQLFAYGAFQRLKASNPKMQDLRGFHHRYTHLLQAKDEKLCNKLDGIVVEQDGAKFDMLLDRYETLFKTAIIS